MTYKERKILLINEGWTIQALADEYKKRKRRPCSREEMSQCIRGVRTYQHLRDFLCTLFKKSETELFGAQQAEQAA